MFLVTIIEIDKYFLRYKRKIIYIPKCFHVYFNKVSPTPESYKYTGHFLISCKECYSDVYRKLFMDHETAPVTCYIIYTISEV